MKVQQLESNQGTQICLFYMQLKGKAKLQNCHINSVTMPLQLFSFEWFAIPYTTFAEIRP